MAFVMFGQQLVFLCLDFCFCLEKGKVLKPMAKFHFSDRKSSIVTLPVLKVLVFHCRVFLKLRCYQHSVTLVQKGICLDMLITKNEFKTNLTGLTFYTT